MTTFTYNYAAYRYARKLCLTTNPLPPTLYYGALCPPPQPHYDTIIAYLPKGQLLTNMILRMAATLLSPHGRLLLVGQNNAGIRSTVTLLAEAIGPTHKVDMARHCLLLRATMRATTPLFDVEEWGATYQIEVNRTPLAIVCFPGVFSYGRLDEGTQLLLSTLTTPMAGRVLDFGCGSGVIGAAIKLLSPAAVIDLVDVDALALMATSCTFAANGMTAETIYPSDVFSDVYATYDWIVSNPPFHEGVQTDYQVVTTFFKQAATYLTSGGRLRLVANRFLKYQPLIEAHVGNCRILAENAKYRVYEATRESNRRTYGQTN